MKKIVGNRINILALMGLSIQKRRMRNRNRVSIKHSCE